MDNDKLVHELAEAICDYLIRASLCESERCDECIKKYAKIIIDFDKDIVE